jgi:excisionase family DNA binding protein
MAPKSLQPGKVALMRSETESFTNAASQGRTKPIWVSPREASLLTGIGLTRLYELFKDGTLVSRKVGRKRLVSFESLELLGESQRVAHD